MEYFLVILLLAGLFIIYSCVKIVPQSQEWLLESFGRYTKTLSPGLHLITPFVDRVARRISLQETVLDIPSQLVITRDNASVSTDGVVFYQVINSAKVAYEVANLQSAITNLAQTNLRTVVGSMNLDEVLSERDSINERLLRVVDAATSTWGVKVTRIEIKDLSPPVDITNSMARVMKAERDRRAEITSAEGEKAAAVLRAEGAKQAAILQAEGRREAAYRDAEAREREAQAEATATKLVSDAIGAGNTNALNYFIAQKYVVALEKLASAPNQKVIMMPLETTGIIGSIAGVAELAKSALQNNNAITVTDTAPKPQPSPFAMPQLPKKDNI